MLMRLLLVSLTTASLDTTYEYRVAVYDALGDSPFSNVINMTTPV